jgi:dTDP-glucose 4,6-dehydratase
LDLNRDLDRIEATVREFRPDYVVNFAAQGMVAQSWTCPEHWYQTNTLAMVRLHDRLRKFSFLRKFVQASTPEVYGSTAGLVNESAPWNPSTPYAVSKAACDMNLLAFKKAYGFPAVLTRAANVCGPGQQLYRIIPKTILCILTGKKLRLEGGGSSVRSFIHIRDVVEGTIRAAQEGVPGEVYHLATDRAQTIRELVSEICRQMGASFDDCVEVAEGRLGQDSAYLLDCAKARTQLGFCPQWTLEDAIRETIEWVKRNLPRLRELPAEYIHKE